MPAKKLAKHPLQDDLVFSPEDLRWATPEIVANYRAKRLKCNVIADLGCGIGLQTFAFANCCKKVYAVDIDQEKISKAKLNAKTLGLTNIEFICGDAMDDKIVSQLHDVEIVFCDPERLPQENQREVESIQPNIPLLLKKYSKLTSRIAIEFPPQIHTIPFDCEREYLSLNGTLNRLTLYFGGLQRNERSAVILPTEEMIHNNPKSKLSTSAKLMEFLYEADPAVVKAELSAELSQLTSTSMYQQSKFTFFTSSKLEISPFFSKSYQVIIECPFEDEEIIRQLQNNNAGKVILRFQLNYQDYWKVRNRYEQQLTGTGTYFLFKFGDKAVITKGFNAATLSKICSF